eukprot:5990814-Pyramimonas_sp.AAC.1
MHVFSVGYRSRGARISRLPLPCCCWDRYEEFKLRSSLCYLLAEVTSGAHRSSGHSGPRRGGA